MGRIMGCINTEKLHYNRVYSIFLNIKKPFFGDFGNGM